MVVVALRALGVLRTQNPENPEFSACSAALRGLSLVVSLAVGLQFRDVEPA